MSIVKLKEELNHKLENLNIIEKYFLERNISGDNLDKYCFEILLDNFDKISDFKKELFFKPEFFSLLKQSNINNFVKNIINITHDSLNLFLFNLHFTNEELFSIFLKIKPYFDFNFVSNEKLQLDKLNKTYIIEMFNNNIIFSLYESNYILYPLSDIFIDFINYYCLINNFRNDFNEFIYPSFSENNELHTNALMYIFINLFNNYDYKKEDFQQIYQHVINMDYVEKHMFNKILKMKIPLYYFNKFFESEDEINVNKLHYSKTRRYEFIGNLYSLLSKKDSFKFIQDFSDDFHNCFLLTYCYYNFYIYDKYSKTYIVNDSKYLDNNHGEILDFTQKLSNKLKETKMNQEEIKDFLFDLFSKDYLNNARSSSLKLVEKFLFGFKDAFNSIFKS